MQTYIASSSWMSADWKCIQCARDNTSGSVQTLDIYLRTFIVTANNPHCLSQEENYHLQNLINGVP